MARSNTSVADLSRAAMLLFSSSELDASASVDTGSFDIVREKIKRHPTFPPAAAP